MEGNGTKRSSSHSDGAGSEPDASDESHRSKMQVVRPTPKWLPKGVESLAIQDTSMEPAEGESEQNKSYVLATRTVVATTDELFSQLDGSPVMYGPFQPDESFAQHQRQLDEQKINEYWQQKVLN